MLSGQCSGVCMEHRAIGFPISTLRAFPGRRSSASSMRNSHADANAPNSLPVMAREPIQNATLDGGGTGRERIALLVEVGVVAHVNAAGAGPLTRGIEHGDDGRPAAGGFVGGPEAVRAVHIHKISLVRRFVQHYFAQALDILLLPADTLSMSGKEATMATTAQSYCDGCAVDGVFHVGECPRPEEPRRSVLLVLTDGQGRTYGGDMGRESLTRLLYPLRKVVSPGNAAAGSRDDLSCGHSIVAASDIYGARFPTSRRCRLCWEALTPEEQAARRDAREARRQQARARKLRQWQDYVRGPKT